MKNKINLNISPKMKNQFKTKRIDNAFTYFSLQVNN